jgi:phosphomannomutase
LSSINRYIFRKNGIRGIAGDDLTAEVCRRIGLCCAGLLSNPVILGRDQRLSSPELSEAVADGLRAAGRDVIDVGTSSRGMAGYAGMKEDRDVAYLSASHLPPEWNGIKFFYGNGISFGNEEITAMKERVLAEREPDSPGGGGYTEMEIKKEYLGFLQKRIPEAESATKILVDCGNGTASLVAPELLSLLGFEVTPLFDTLDGTFPNRESEIDEHTLQPTVPYMAGHDMGIAYDGDADRVALITSGGRVLDAEEISYLILNELLKTREGDIVANIGCGATIDFIAKKHGRKVYRTPVGATSMLRKLEEIGGSLGLESSMHICIPHILPFDDGVAVSAYAAYALSVLKSRRTTTLEGLLEEIPPRFKKKMAYDVPDEVKFGIMEEIVELCKREYGDVNTIDGVRIDFEDKWVLVRQSDTSPMIRVMAEADTEEDVEELVAGFSKLVEERLPQS